MNLKNTLRGIIREEVRRALKEGTFGRNLFKSFNDPDSSPLGMAIQQVEKLRSFESVGPDMSGEYGDAVVVSFARKPDALKAHEILKPVLPGAKFGIVKEMGDVNYYYDLVISK